MKLRAASASFRPPIEGLGWLNLDCIDLVLLGGESGPLDEIRELDLGWMESIIRQCRKQGTGVFVKQLGQLWASNHDTDHRYGGHTYDWPEDLQIREMPRIYPDQPELDPSP